MAKSKAQKKAQEVKAKRQAKISLEAVARFNRKPAELSPLAAVQRVFQAAVPAPGVVPQGHNGGPRMQAGMAFDDQILEILPWAAGATYNAAFVQGVTFLGYPYLAELAQRPEYRRPAEILAQEMTRAWIELTSKGDDDKTDQINAIKDECKRLNVQGIIRKLIETDNYFGRAHLYLDTGVNTVNNVAELATPIGNGTDAASKSKFKKGDLKRLAVIEPMWTYPAQYNSDNPLVVEWYHPSSWFVQGRAVHETRLLTYVSREVPDMLKPAYSFGGLSLSQMLKPYVDNWLRTRQNVADLIGAFSTSGIKTDLGESLQADGDELFRRLTIFNATRSNMGVMALNNGATGEVEEFFNVSTPLGTLDVLQAQTQEHMSAVVGIPLVKLFGIQPAGLNASSDGEIQTFDDNILAGQNAYVRPILNTVLNFIQLNIFGAVDPDIEWDFLPLRTLMWA